MTKRLISANASDMLAMTGAELKQSIKASEGRVICSEDVAVHESYIGDITNAEIARAFGADLILLNAVDVLHPELPGLSQDPADGTVVDQLHRLVGRPIGVNLEPVDEDAAMAEDRISIARGRQANAETAAEIERLGFDFVCLTGNPGTGVTNAQIARAIGIMKEHFSGLIIAGKMHGAGVDEPVCDEESVEAFVSAGADVILVRRWAPSPALPTPSSLRSCARCTAVARSCSRPSARARRAPTRRPSRDRHTQQGLRRGHSAYRRRGLLRCGAG